MISNQRKSFDYATLAIVLSLCVFGLIMITSAGSAIGFQKFQDSYFYVKRQMISFAIGFALMLFLLNLDYHLLKKWALPAFVASIVGLVLVFIPGIGANLLGGSRWITIAGLPLQPSEFVKLGFIIYLASWLDGKKTRFGRNDRPYIIQLIILMVVVVGLIIAQPDMGTMSVVVAISLSMIFISGIDTKYIFRMLAIIFAGMLLLIKIAPYRLQRLTAFIDPSADPRGVGYHIQQSLIAIGTGGIFGLGLGKSRQKFTYLPEPTGDSIFSVISEELGLIIGVALIVLFVVLFLRGIRIARQSPDSFGKLLATGIISWISIQAIFNISALSGLMPLTGITLPFISYGGSSIIATLAAVGVLLNISKQVTKHS